MRGLIVVNAYFKGESAVHQQQRLCEALRQQGSEVDVLPSDRLLAYIDREGVISTVGKRDYVVFLDKDPHLSYLLEKAGYRLYNSARAIELCDDKMRTCIALCGEVPMPKTLSSPLMYSPCEDGDFAARAAQALGFPMIVKTCFGSMGYGVRLVSDMQQLREVREQWKLQPHLYQQYVKQSAGRDIRVIVIGERAIGAIERVNEGDFRSNVEQGGRATAIPLTSEMASVAERAARTLGLDYCGVDLLCGEKGYLVCEVNSNAYFRAFEQATATDVAGEYAAHILRSCKY